MTAVASQTVSAAGAATVYNAGNASNDIPNSSGRTIVIVKNASGGSINATFKGQGKIGSDQTVADRVVAVPAGAERAFWLDPVLYNKADGTVQMDLSATASVTVAVLNTPA